MSSKFAVILDNEELNSNFSTYADAETYSAQLPGSEIEEYEVPDPETGEPVPWPFGVKATAPCPHCNRENDDPLRGA